MAWLELPVEAGDPIRAAEVNELRTAGIERQIFYNPTHPQPQPVTARESVISDLHYRIRIAMQASIDTGRWKWPTTNGNHKTWDRSANPETNIFKAAFGEMNWRNSVAPGAPKLAQAMNDTKAVFDKMCWVAGSISSYSVAGDSRMYPIPFYAPDNPLPEPAYAYWNGQWRNNLGSLLGCDGRAWTPSEGLSLSLPQRTDSSLLNWWEYAASDPYYQTSQERYADTYAVYIPYTYPIDRVGARFTTWAYLEWMQRSAIAPYPEQTIRTAPSRTVHVYVRLNGSAPPAGDYVTRTSAGTHYAEVIASHPQTTRWFDALVNNPTGGHAYLTIYGDQVPPSQTDLLYFGWIDGRDYTIWWKREDIHWGFPSGTLCHCGFQKLHAPKP